LLFKKRPKFTNAKYYKKGSAKAFSLRFRLLTVFIGLVITSTSFIGINSYNTSADRTVDLVEQRLDREVTLANELIKNAMFANVGDEESFLKQLNQIVLQQKSALSQDELYGQFFLIEPDQFSPLGTSSSNVNLSEKVMEQIKLEKKGIIHSDIDQHAYTLAFFDSQELKGQYVIAIPQENYLSQLYTLGTSIFWSVLIAVAITILITILIVQSISKPMTILRNKMKEVREGNLILGEHEKIKTSIPEINSLDKSFSVMMDHIYLLVNNLNQTSTELSDTGQILHKTSIDLVNENNPLREKVKVLINGAQNTTVQSDQNLHYFYQMRENLKLMVIELEQLI